MGMRGYILIKLEKQLNEDELWRLIKATESIKDVEYVSHLIGKYDLCITVDTHDTLDSVTEVIKKNSIFAEVITLKENNVFKKHREIKDLKILDNLY